nr:putative reverse transcriptase domain-containing protein [Tanacetum cinerariifolium]
MVVIGGSQGEEANEVFDEIYMCGEKCIYKYSQGEEAKEVFDEIYMCVEKCENKMMTFLNPPFLYLLDKWLYENLKWRITLLTGLGRSGLGQTMNGKTYRCVLCYRLGVLLFSILKPYSTCSSIFARDIYGDHVVLCVGIIGIKHRHNVVRDTLVDICYRSGILAGKEIDIGLEGGCDKPLRPADMLLYSWDGRLDVYVDLTGSSPLTQTGMVDFALDHAAIDATQRKRVKYEAKCATIGYGFLPFSFSSLGELEKDAVKLLRRIRKFSIAQDIGAVAAVYIFNMIGFAAAKGEGTYKEGVLSWLNEVSLVDEVFDGAFGRVGDEEVVVGEGVVRFLSSFVRSTNSCFRGTMVSLIFLKPWEEEA